MFFLCRCLLLFLFSALDFFFFFFKQKTAYEMRISDWSSDVCSTDLTAEYLFDVGSMQGQVGAVYRWVGDRVNDTTERQRVTAPGDPSTILDEQITAPMELDSYGALDLYAGFGKDAWSVRAYVNNVADERAWSSVSPAASALTGAVVQIGAVPIQPRMFGIEFDYRF